METKPKVSVIISTYNRHEFLKKAIDSVLSQTLKDVEVVVVDDNSTDKTEETVKGFADPRIVYIKLKENHGHDGHPKNRGILVSKADIVAFLDDDDQYYKKEALNILLRYLEAGKVDVVYGDYLGTKEKSLSELNSFADLKAIFKKEKSLGLSVDFNPQILAKQNFISMCTVMARKEKIMEVGGFNEEIRQFKDWNLWMRLHKNGCQFLHVPILTTLVRYHKESISAKNKLKFDADGSYLPTFNPADCRIYADKTCIGEFKPKRVAVFTLTKDRLEYTKKMYWAMKKTAGYEFDWYPIDQASTDGTAEWLTELSKMVGNRTFPTFLKENTGVALGWMRGVEEVRKAKKHDIIIKIDNDALMLTPDWLKDMVSLFDCNKGLILSPTVEGLEGTPGGVLRQKMDGGSPYVMINDKVLGIVPNLGGIVFASYLSLYDGFSFPKDIPGNKDYYLSKYALSRGYSPFYMEECVVQHMGGSQGQTKNYK